MTDYEQGFSPDIGKYVVRHGIVYCEDGEVFPEDIEHCFRSMPMEHGVDYSQWSDEKRAQVKAEYSARYEENQRKEQADRDRINALRASARAKLTDEEIEACDLEDDEP